jgi:hypothetical protein
MDLYRELQAVTPDSFQYLLQDLFERNTFLELGTERASAQQTEAATWQVTLAVRARKVVVDEAGVETEVPMDDWLEVGVFDEGAPYLQSTTSTPEPAIHDREDGALRLHRGVGRLIQDAPHLAVALGTAVTVVSCPRSPRCRGTHPSTTRGVWVRETSQRWRRLPR